MTSGKEVRVEQNGKEVHVIFVAVTVKEADVLRDTIITQLKMGKGFILTLSGEASRVAEQ